MLEEGGGDNQKHPLMGQSTPSEGVCEGAIDAWGGNRSVAQLEFSPLALHRIHDPKGRMKISACKLSFKRKGKKKRKH